MNISLAPVDSSQIAAVGHDSPSETLAIQFRGKGNHPGAIYHYNPVPLGMYEDLIGAESIGKFFGMHIKGKPGISYRKIETEKEEA